MKSMRSICCSCEKIIKNKTRYKLCKNTKKRCHQTCINVTSGICKSCTLQNWCYVVRKAAVNESASIADSTVKENVIDNDSAVNESALIADATVKENVIDEQYVEQDSAVNESTSIADATVKENETDEQYVEQPVDTPTIIESTIVQKKDSDFKRDSILVESVDEKKKMTINNNGEVCTTTTPVSTKKMKKRHIFDILNIIARKIMLNLLYNTRRKNLSMSSRQKEN